MPIDKVYLDSAVEIRREWINVLKNIFEYEKEIEITKKLIQEKKKKLEDYSKTKPNIKDPKLLQFFEEMFSDLEIQSSIMEQKIKPMNSEIEKLRKEELRLHKVISSRYPGLSDEEIKREVWEHIKDIHL